MHPKIKISVLKVFKPEEVFKENPPMKMVTPGPCPTNKLGETFVVDGFDQTGRTVRARLGRYLALFYDAEKQRRVSVILRGARGMRHYLP